MKIVIKLTRLAENNECAMQFARAVACLFQDYHSVAIVHGYMENTGADAVGPEASCPAIAQVETENRNLVARLNRVGMTALGVCGGDGRIFEIRKSRRACDQALMELASVNPRWLEVICSNRGVPVISNVAVASWGQHGLLDADEMAAACAKAWRADALIYLTSVDGVRDLDGSTIRWLDVKYLEILKTKAAITQNMVGKLQACRVAIESGVGRVRILPLSHVDSLPFLFLSRIDFGTEVTAL